MGQKRSGPLSADDRQAIAAAVWSDAQGEEPEPEPEPEQVSFDAFEAGVYGDRDFMRQAVARASGGRGGLAATWERNRDYFARQRGEEPAAAATPAANAAQAEAPTTEDEWETAVAARQAELERLDRDAFEVHEAAFNRAAYARMDREAEAEAGQFEPEPEPESEQEEDPE